MENNHKSRRGCFKEAAYSYIGEYSGDYNELVYLRARFYAPGMGRFLTKDPSSAEANLYLYTAANPVNRIDPAGLNSISISGLSGPAAFAACFDIHTGTQGTTIYYSAQMAVWTCKMAYSPEAWSAYSGSFGLNTLRPTTAHQLMGWFVYENLWNDIVFDGTEPLTRELAVSSLVQIVRNKFYREGETPKPVEYQFHTADYFKTLFGDSRNSYQESSLPITAFIGSFWYQVKKLPNNRIGFRIDNDTTLESGTHIRERYLGQYSGSVEELIEQNPSLANRSIFEVIRDNRVISILKSKTRQQTTGLEGGGDMYQTFVWSERYDECSGWMMYFLNDRSKLDIQTWADFRANTDNPPLPGK